MSKEIIGKKILSANEEYAFKNSQLLADNKLLCLNMISSPGSGKTTLLARTCTDLKDKLSIGVIEGDIRTDLDAQRIRATEAAAVQIETNGACHLAADQINRALQILPMKNLDVVVIENVGNLVCPSAFELGEHAKVVVLSVAEGDDKPAKYPAIFAKSDVLLVNKIDLLEAAGLSDFDLERVRAEATRLNKDIKIFPVSARTGQGMKDWYDYLVSKTRS